MHYDDDDDDDGYIHQQHCIRINELNLHLKIISSNSYPFSIRYDGLLNEFLVEEYLPLSFIHHILRNFFVPLQILTEVTS